MQKSTGGEVRASFPRMKKLMEQEEKGAWENRSGGSVPSLKHCDFVGLYPGHWNQCLLPPE